jgi:hypothetical protein
MKTLATAAALLLLTAALPRQLSAQITNVVFFDDFSTDGIDTNKYAIDAPFFEGGKGDIAPAQANGVVQFTGTVTNQYWAGATLRLKQPFTVSEQTNVIVSVDRVAEAGVGTSSRSALWIMDPSQSHYVLFADNSLETHWEYNRKIGEAGDVPTGGGTAIAAFNDPLGPFLDEGLHRMKAIVDGKTVKLYLDDVFGAEVKFPFTNVIFQIGSYARANGDTADTTFDNLEVDTVGAVTFSTKVLTLTAGQTASNITVQIPPGVNATAPVQIRVVSSDPTVAAGVGAAGGTLTLTFAAGATNVQTIPIQALATGGTQFTFENDIGLAAGNVLDVTVISGPGIQLQDDFSGTEIDSTKWQVSDLPFEPGPGAGTFTETEADGVLQISGTLDFDQYWGGATIKSVKSFTATADLPLTVDVDRLSIDPVSTDTVTPSTGARTGVFLANDDRSKFVFFAQDVGETGWEVNVNPGNPTGGGTALAAFSSMNDTNAHHMKLVADGSGVDLYLDNKFGARVDFPVSSGIHVEIGSFARAVGDAVVGKFDNVKVDNEFPCISVAPLSLSEQIGDMNFVTVTIPRLLNNAANASVTLTSSDPAVLLPLGASNGAVTLNFAAGTTNVQTLGLKGIKTGTATITMTTAASACIDNGVVTATVTTVPSTLLSDDFSSGTINSNLWVEDSTPLLDGAVATVDSGLGITNGAVSIGVTTDEATPAQWPGFALGTVQKFSATQTSPVSFEVDRVKLGFTLVTGTGAKEQTGVWVMDSTGTNYVFFTEYLTHDGTAGGWEYFRNIGQTGDTPVTGAGISIPAFGAAQYNDQGNHRMRVEANGSTVRLFLDGVVGAEVPFPFADDLSFKFGAYVMAATDVTTAIFDNARVLGTGPGTGGGTLSASIDSTGAIVISWTGTGVLQSSPALGPTAAWTDVTPAPTGNSITVPASGQGTARFYRLR